MTILAASRKLRHHDNSTKGRFHRPGLILQSANPRLRDNRGLSTACVPSSS